MDVTKALPSDGWRSRKVIAGAAAWGVGVAVATVALFTKVASFDEWSNFLLWYTGSLYGLLSGTLHMDKREQAKVAVARIAAPAGAAEEG